MPAVRIAIFGAECGDFNLSVAQQHDDDAELGADFKRPSKQANNLIRRASVATS